MHTHFRAFFKKFLEKIYLFTCSHWEVPNYRVFLKNFLSGKKPSHLFGIAKPNDTLFHRKNEKIFFRLRALYFACRKSPFTYSHWGRPNAHPESQKILSLHLFGIERSKRNLFFRKRQNFFEKTVCLKNIPSLVPTGRGYLGIVISKKGKKICPPT